VVSINNDVRVPKMCGHRLDELAEILARGIRRMEEQKRGCERKNRLEVSAKTSLTVTQSGEPDESEVT